MMKILGSQRVAFVLVVLLAVTLSGCGRPQQPDCQVSDLFNQYYEDLGGLDTLGPCLMGEYTKNGLTYQFVQNALLRYNPEDSTANRFGLSSVGTRINLDLSDLPEGGYQVWEEVQPIMDATGGDIGRALTEVLRNDEKQRYEQFYDGAGFYRNYGDPPGTIHWMEYGEWMLKQSSFDEMTHTGQPTPQVTPGVGEYTQAMVAYAERLGKTFTGNLLSSEATLAWDGLYELVYENVVLVLDPENPANVSLRRLPEMLGYAVEPGGSCVAREGYMCFPLEDGLVYMLPVVFYDFWVEYGNVAGDPTTSVHPGESGTSYQCLENVCVQFDGNAPEAERVSVMPLGITYFRRDTTAVTTPDVYANKLVLQAWPSYPLLPNGQAQEIYVQAIEGRRPVQGILFNLSLTYPDGTLFQENFPLTDINGQAYITLDPITAPDATNVPYEVCYLDRQEQPICFTGFFTIWSLAP